MRSVAFVQNGLLINKSMGEPPFPAHQQSWCSLHCMDQLDNNSEQNKCDWASVVAQNSFAFSIYAFSQVFHAAGFFRGMRSFHMGRSYISSFASLACLDTFTVRNRHLLPFTPWLRTCHHAQQHLNSCDPRSPVLRRPCSNVPRVSSPVHLRWLTFPYLCRETRPR